MWKNHSQSTSLRRHQPPDVDLFSGRDTAGSLTPGAIMKLRIIVADVLPLSIQGQELNGFPGPLGDALLRR